jgi:hypothetical protein
MKKRTFSKQILLTDYAVLGGLLFLFGILEIKGHDTANLAVVVSAWIAQLAVSSGFYYWKAKAENLVKLPIQLMENLPEEMKERADPNQIIDSVINLKD